MASGDILDRFFPPGEPPAANYATFDTRNGHPVLDFDASADEIAVWTSVLPANYSGGGLTVRIYWSATSATSGGVWFYVAIERIDDEGQDTDSDSFATPVGDDFTAPATSGAVQYSELIITTGDMDGLAVGELFRLKVTRSALAIEDTMTGDAEVHAVTIRET